MEGNPYIVDGCIGSCTSLCTSALCFFFTWRRFFKCRVDISYIYCTLSYLYLYLYTLIKLNPTRCFICSYKAKPHELFYLFMQGVHIISH
jgi:hypothetical protein